jgi:hypothetical protein
MFGLRYEPFVDRDRLFRGGRHPLAGPQSASGEGQNGTGANA